MVLKAFAVLDIKANAFLQPVFMPTVGMMTRAFADAVAREGHEFHKHPEDYRLAYIGTFDDSSGRMEPLAAPEFIGAGSDFVSPKEV